MKQESQIIATWIDTDIGTHPDNAALLSALESGKVLHIPAMPFELDDQERALLDPIHASKGRKNISLPPDGPTLIGVDPDSPAHAPLHCLVARYARSARDWIDSLFPQYGAHLIAAPTSLRLHRVETRHTSWRKDDSRLHVDAFPSRPNHGERILRVFMNINPHGEPRVWRVGETFESVAQRFLPRLPRQWPGQASLLHALGITKRYRSRYDHIMLSLHDAMKADIAYQQSCPQESIGFAPGAGWICFSDQTSHAVMAGQFMLEQTFFLQPRDMADPRQSPLAVLETLTGRPLI
ncbi:Kdo hydroxylase family protein [Paludibacterium purpuratum]|uniref:3-deoxy-D-manno-octulosonic acid hydroxylase-like protein n=1 Tax=Paludibacterium purpuratum TaxID=1144873 RepID=A0A4R7B5D3_9NEIS|nr:Kdo hydroxylase family protein [Paludibacterium purpuratum]TDR79801.1 3-deoxy-D-manno-octulosonic acid hydroxylase-like protein [Paludibacterium purpuratum]